MSFFGGSECATNANPLAQFSKQSSADRSVQQSARQGASAELNGRQSKQIRENVMMNQRDRVQLDEFMANKGKMGAGSFDFQPMANEIEAIRMPKFQQPVQQKGMAWTAEFSEGSQQQKQQQMKQTQQQQQQQSQLQQQSQQQSQQTLQSEPGMSQYNNPLMRGMAGMSALTGMGMNFPRYSSLQNVAPTYQSSSTNQVQQTNWEESFKEIEEEQMKNETTAAVNPQVSSLDAAFSEMEKEAGGVEDEEREYEAAWEKDFEKYASGRMNYGDYKFEEENKFQNTEGAYEIGCKLMESGAKLSEAALAFEAAVQENPEHIDAWLKLGQVQTQNEKEFAGIAALEKCLELSPQNLPALMTLAISYVNEGYDNAAYATLERWIETKYPTVVQEARKQNPEIKSDDRYSLNRRIRQLFLKAAQLSPSGANMDADVQTGLGVLFYSMEEYDKTLDCFRAAIRCNPNDALSWNRLGASLANSNRPEQAIEAYTKALQLNPNFVRARYNLGVSFINMGMYKDAVDHLLTGLSMHEVEEPNVRGVARYVSDSNQSTSLLETLKRAFLAMDRRDLVEEVKPGMNVEAFRKKSGF